MSEISLFSCVFFVLWVPGGCRNVPELPSVVGQYAEMDCGAEQQLGPHRPVTWSRRREGGDQVLAQFRMGAALQLSQRVSLLHSDQLYMVLGNVTETDVGSYRCEGDKGRTTVSQLRGTANCSSGFGMTTLNMTGLRLQHLPTVSQAGNSTQTPQWCIGELFVSPCSGVEYAVYRGQSQRRQLVMKGRLHQGYGISLQRGATLVIGRVEVYHAGTYICRMGNTVYKVKLQVHTPGILRSLSGIWIILVTVFISLTLYILIVGLMVSFHRKQKHRTHTERISRIMGSLFRYRPEMDVRPSEQKDSGTELNGTMVRDASCSTNYENLGSHENIGPGDQRSLSERLNAETDAAQSYENLCEDGEADDDDYLDPASEDGSINAEGHHSETLNGPSVYAIPNKGPKMDQASTEGGLRVSSWDTEALPAQCEDTTGDGGSSEEDYAIPDTETPLNLTMDTSGTYTNQSERHRRATGVREHTLDQEGDTDRTLGNDDYMKMCAARNMSQRDVPTNAEGSSAEESVMMERCRKLFMMKFQSNASRYSSQDEAGGSLKTLPRVKNPHIAAFSMTDRMAILPE